MIYISQLYVTVQLKIYRELSVQQPPHDITTVAISDDLSLTAAFFESEQTVASKDDVTGEDVDIKGLTVDGFEAELKGNLTDKFSLVAGFTAMDGETSSDQMMAPTTCPSLVIPKSPRTDLRWTL